MSTMLLYRDFNLHRAPVPGLKGTPADAPPSILRRFFAAIERSRQRRAEQEAGRYIAAHGGRLTDDIERQLGQRF